MTSEGTSLYNLDFRDKQRDLTLQSRLHWQAKGPQFTIKTSLTNQWTLFYNLQNMKCSAGQLHVQLSWCGLCHTTQKSTAFSSTCWQTSVGTLQRQATRESRRKDNQAAKHKQPLLTATLITHNYNVHNNNENIHTQKQDPQNIHC